MEKGRSEECEGVRGGECEVGSKRVGRGEEERRVRERRGEGRGERVGVMEWEKIQRAANSLISSATFCSLS